MIVTSVMSLLLATTLHADPAVDSKTVQVAVEKSLKPLIAGATGHIEKKTCFACHNQTYPSFAFSTARKRGFSISDEILSEQVEHIKEFIASNIDDFRSGKGTGGQVDTATAALWTLELGGAKSCDETTAVIEYLLKTQPESETWKSTSDRPPTEKSHFTSTALAICALNVWKTKDQTEKATKRIAKAKDWLIKTKANDTEDRVFRLIGLGEANAPASEIAAAAYELLGTQRTDGGWSQTASMESDAYATATALVALNQAGQLKTTHPSYQLGMQFLLKTQRNDGTWLIQSRSKPFQPYYESGFPHEKNQFISISATGWATAALALSLPLSK